MADDGAAARGLRPRLAAVRDLPRRGHVVDLDELDPLDVPDDRDLHRSQGHRATLSHALRGPGVTAHDGCRGDSPVRALLRRALRRGARLPPAAARAAGRGRVAGDLPASAPRVRPARARPPPAGVGVHDRDPRRDGRAAPRGAGRRRSASTTRRSRPRTASPSGRVRRSSSTLTGELPPKERAAVVLRYGYDLPYAEIGAALGSSEEAARAAASSGVRRLRRNVERHT